MRTISELLGFDMYSLALFFACPSRLRCLNYQQKCGYQPAPRPQNLGQPKDFPNAMVPIVGFLMQTCQKLRPQSHQTLPKEWTGEYRSAVED